jgi:putative phosphoribosyl transferase
VICLAAPRAFLAIGAFYKDFQQLGDDEVVDLLRRATRSEKAPMTTAL